MENNYIDIFKPEHHRSRRYSGNVHEHIIVAEEMLGRLLRDTEVVHHEDGDRTNNNPSNLYVFKSQKHHARYHMNGVKIRKEDYWISPPQKGTIENPYSKICGWCSAEYETVEKSSIFCGDKCYRLSTRVVERPNKKALYELLVSNSFTKVGKMFGVSDNAVRKWCKSYGIPDKAGYYRKKYR